MYKKRAFFLVFFLFSCHVARLTNAEIEEIEKVDDNLCMMEGVEYTYKEIRALYWNCRLRIMDQRIAGFNKNSGYDLFYKTEFKKLKEIIKQRRDNEIEKAITEVKNSFEEKEHALCLMLANKNASQSLEKGTDKMSYMRCRETLEEERMSKNDNYDPLDNNEFLGIKDEKTIKEELEKQRKDVLIIETDCVKYAGDEKKLLECMGKIGSVEGCLKNIDNLIKIREIDDKLYCIKASVEKYPDEMAKYTEDEKKSIADSKFVNPDAIVKKVQPKKKKINVGPKISIDDLIALRETETNRCNRQRRLKMPSYKEHLNKGCHMKTEL